MVLGLEVPHAHIHLVPMQSEHDLLNFADKTKLPEEEMEQLAKLIAENID